MTLNTGKTIHYKVAPNLGYSYTKKDISNIQRWIGVLNKEDGVSCVGLIRGENNESI